MNKIPLPATFLLALAILIPCVASADIKPANPETPLFRVFASEPAKPGSPDLPRITFNDKRPLLSVFSVQGVMLARDQKGVLLSLNDHDARVFASLTRKYNGSVLILQTGDGNLEAAHITAPITDGRIGFKHPQEAAFADYLRRRFHMAEYKTHP